MSGSKKDMPSVHVYEAPFRHWEFSTLFSAEACRSLGQEILEIPDDDRWVRYDNACERKRSCNRDLPKAVDAVLKMLVNEDMRYILGTLANKPNLAPDPWLHGGGVHVIDPGGFLGCHLDYARHPKHASAERALNLVLFMSDCRGGGGQLRFHDVNGEQVVKEIEGTPGMAVAWEPTDESYHSVAPVAKDAPPRVTLAAYYLTSPCRSHVKRTRALFVPPRGNTK